MRKKALSQRGQAMLKIKALKAEIRKLKAQQKNMGKELSRVHADRELLVDSIINQI